MRMFTMRNDLQITEEDGARSKDICIQVHINEEGFNTDTILGILDNVTQNSQELIMSAVIPDYDNMDCECDPEEGGDIL